MVGLPCFPPPHLAFKNNPSYIPGLWTCCPMTGGFIIFEGRVGATSARQRCAHAQAQSSTKLVLVPTGSAFFCCVLASYGVLWWFSLLWSMIRVLFLHVSQSLAFLFCIRDLVPSKDVADDNNGDVVGNSVFSLLPWNICARDGPISSVFVHNSLIHVLYMSFLQYAWSKSFGTDIYCQY